jgi:hypothetical protein
MSKFIKVQMGERATWVNLNNVTYIQKDEDENKYIIHFDCSSNSGSLKERNFIIITDSFGKVRNRIRD